MSSITSRLENLEESIEAYQRHRLKAAKALKEISEDELYEQRGFESLVNYAQARYGFRSGRTYQLIRYARVHAILDEEDNTPTPVNEAQARFLGRLLDTEYEDDIPDVWSDAIDASEHGLENVTMSEVQSAVTAHLEDEEEDEDEPDRSDVDLKVPTDTADELGLSGEDYRGRRIVSWNGYTRSDVQEIIDRTEPNDEKPPNFDGEPVLADRIWRPVQGENTEGRLQMEVPDRVVFRPTQAPRLEEATKMTLDSPTTLACPAVDLLADDVPDPLTEEIIDRSSGTDWEPILHSTYHERWANYSLPDEAWVGSSASRSSLEDVADALGSADDTEKKWVLYDLGSDDKQNGLPQVDLSPIDWVVIDSLTHTHLTYRQLNRLVETAEDRTVTLAVRDPFDTKLETTP